MADRGYWREQPTTTRGGGAGLIPSSSHDRRWYRHDHYQPSWRQDPLPESSYAGYYRHHQRDDLHRHGGPSYTSRPLSSHPPSLPSRPTHPPCRAPPRKQVPPPTPITTASAAQIPVVKPEDHQPNAEQRSRLRRRLEPTAPPAILSKSLPHPPSLTRRAQTHIASRGRGRGNGRHTHYAPSPGRSPIQRPSPPRPSKSYPAREPSPVFNATEKPRGVHQLLPWERPTDVSDEVEEVKPVELTPESDVRVTNLNKSKRRRAAQPSWRQRWHEEEEEVEPLPVEDFTASYISSDTMQVIEKDNEVSEQKMKKKKERKGRSQRDEEDGQTTKVYTEALPCKPPDTRNDGWHPVVPIASEERHGIMNKKELERRSSLEKQEATTRSQAHDANDQKRIYQRFDGQSVTSNWTGNDRCSDRNSKSTSKSDALDRAQSDLRDLQPVTLNDLSRYYPGKQAYPVVPLECLEPSSKRIRTDEPESANCSTYDDGEPCPGLDKEHDVNNDYEEITTPPLLGETESNPQPLEPGSQQRQMSVTSDDIPLSMLAFPRKQTSQPGDHGPSSAVKAEGSTANALPPVSSSAEHRKDTTSRVAATGSTHQLRLGDFVERLDISEKRKATQNWRWRWMAMLDCQSSLNNEARGTKTPSSALLSISAKGKTSLRILSTSDKDTVDSQPSHHISFSGEMHVEAVRRVSSHSVAVASSSRNRIGEGGPQVSLVFAKDQRGRRDGNFNDRVDRITARASVLHLDQRPHVTGATTIAPFLPLSDPDALTMVTGGADGAVFAWSYLASSPSSKSPTSTSTTTTTTRLHALHSGPVTSIETLPKLDMVVSASTVSRNGTTQLIAFDGRETKLIHAWKSSDLVAHLSKTSHPRLLDVSFLRADYDQHKLYDLRVPMNDGDSADATSSSSSSSGRVRTDSSSTQPSTTSRNPTKPVLSFGWSSEYEIPFLGRPAFKSNYCFQGCPDGKLRLWDLRWASDVLQEVAVAERGMSLSDVLLWEEDSKAIQRGYGDEEIGNPSSRTERGRNRLGCASILALSPDAAWKVPLV